jgi:hypothetical protein
MNRGGPTPHNIDWSDTAILLPIAGQDIGNDLGMSAEVVRRFFVNAIKAMDISFDPEAEADAA